MCSTGVSGRFHFALFTVLDHGPDQGKEDEAIDRGHVLGLPRGPDHTGGQGGRGLKQ